MNNGMRRKTHTGKHWSSRLVFWIKLFKYLFMFVVRFTLRFWKEIRIRGSKVLYPDHFNSDPQFYTTTVRYGINLATITKSPSPTTPLTLDPKSFIAGSYLSWFLPNYSLLFSRCPYRARDSLQLFFTRILIQTWQTTTNTTSLGQYQVTPTLFRREPDSPGKMFQQKKFAP